MRIELADWLLEVDVSLTMDLSVSQAKDRCMCGYCKNYYLGVDQAYPALRPFMQKFGVDIEGPDELCPFEPTIYEASYVVQGKIVHRGQQKLYINDVPLTIRTAAEIDLCTEHPQPYFTLTVGLLELPWQLNEPMSEVISPANEDAFLRRMEEKLLRYLDEENMYS